MSGDEGSAMDSLGRAAARLRQSDDRFRQAVADWLASIAAVHQGDDWVTCECDDKRHALKVADGVLGESLPYCEAHGLPTPCVWCNS